MRGAAGLLSLLAALLTVLAGCESENEAACRQYLAYYTSLPCAAGVDPGVDCNAFADYPCPIADYFDCQQQGHTCDEAGGLSVDVTRKAGEEVIGTCSDLLDCEG